MSKHTKGPWRCRLTDHAYLPEKVYAIDAGEFEDTLFYSTSTITKEENAKRIVSCVNALEGIDDPKAFVESYSGMLIALREAQSELRDLSPDHPSKRMINDSISKAEKVKL